ncbi:MAG: hypothetical protein KatS3mg131_3139 [Candidatus Tectimicrobiota bacterium]|nr:MAG: hypothetical protein KatS3mg131_3139 [Candidatus Tectomicrobia bacterium]
MRGIKVILLGVGLAVSLLGRPWPAWSYSLFGPGWDGPGLGSATVLYHFGPLTSDLPEDVVKDTLRAALDVWAAVANLTFIETATAGLPQAIDFSFTTLSPGDILAFAFPPPPWNSETHAGDVVFDDAELWEVGNGLGGAAYDLLWVAVHEVGHALGLGHSDVFGSVMYPFVSADTAFTGLHADDIAGILALYAAAPEPGTLVLLASGLGGLLGLRRRARSPLPGARRQALRP